MTANDIFETGCILAGKSNFEDYLNEKDFFSAKALLLINQALCELGIEAVSDINNELAITVKQADAAFYAVARLIASSCDDSTRLIELTDIYNAKRAGVLGNVTARKNVIPTV